MIHSYEIPLSGQASELFSELFFGPDPIFNVFAICHHPQKIETVSSPFNISVVGSFSRISSMAYVLLPCVSTIQR
jgi:hypothetical protein